MTIEESRTALLEATLAHVPFDGWTEKAIHAGARDLGLDEVAAVNAFPGGVRELVACFSETIDARMLEAMEAQDLESMRVRDRVALGVRCRLELLDPYQEAVRRGLSYLALPHNGPLATRLLWRTVDAIWYAAGDTATDYNYYSKRILLSGVYSSTLLYWLNDQSEGRAATWSFLDRRIDDVMRIGGRIGRNVKQLINLPDELVRRRDGLKSRLRRRFG